MRIASLLVPCLLAACAGDADLSPDAGAVSEGETTQEATTLSVTLTSEPPAIGNSPNVTFTYTTNKTATMTCRLDTQSYVRCPATAKSFSGLADGDHSFDLRATANGKQVAIPTYHFTITTTAPTVAITGAPASLSATRTPTFSFVASAGTTACSVDLQPSFACTSPTTVGPLADGGHSFSVLASAGGSTAVASYSWTIDATAPSVSSPGYTCDSSGFLSVTWSASDATSGIASGTCTYGFNTFDCTNVRSWDGYLSGSSTPFVVTYRDVAGNTRTTSRTINATLCL